MQQLCRLLFVLAHCAASLYSCSAFLDYHIFPKAEESNVVSGDQVHVLQHNQANSGALLLTPYIDAGKLSEGRQLSAVKRMPNGAPQLESFSGFFTVNKTYNSNMFFWFFPALVSFEM